jgi:hypothetical protein
LVREVKAPPPPPQFLHTCTGTILPVYITCILASPPFHALPSAVHHQFTFIPSPRQPLLFCRHYSDCSDKCRGGGGRTCDHSPCIGMRCTADLRAASTTTNQCVTASITIATPPTLYLILSLASHLSCMTQKVESKFLRSHIFKPKRLLV